MDHLTLVGMKSGLLAQATIKMLDRSEPSSDLGEESNTRQYDPRMA
jgi:hypothetical protein